MSYTYLQEQGEESSVECFSDIPASVLSRSRNTLEKSSCNGSGTESCHTSQSGTTYKLSTENRGEVESMLSREDSPVWTSVQPGEVPASKENDLAFGQKWLELSVKYSRDSSSWKTHLCLWEEDLPWSSVTLPKWGMMRDGVCWEQTTPGLPTEGNGSGSWPTPVHSEARQGYQNRNNGKKGTQKSLTTMVVDRERERMPTPTSRDWKGKSGAGRQEKKGHPTDTLLNYVDKWPTPVASDSNGANSREHCETNGTGRKLRFATPQARDFRTGQRSRWENPDRTRNLNDQVGGQLNPAWVEWLMGWPLEWTDLKPLGTDRFRMWPHSPGKF